MALKIVEEVRLSSWGSASDSCKRDRYRMVKYLMTISLIISLSSPFDVQDINISKYQLAHNYVKLAY